MLIVNSIARHRRPKFALFLPITHSPENWIASSRANFPRKLAHVVRSPSRRFPPIFTTSFLLASSEFSLVRFQVTNALLQTVIETDKLPCLRFHFQVGAIDQTEESAPNFITSLRNGWNADFAPPWTLHFFWKSTGLADGDVVALDPSLDRSTD